MFARCCVALGLVAAMMGASRGADDEPEEYVKVEIKGRLQTGVVAIGGETTGTVIQIGGITWELDFGKNAELKRLAGQLSEQAVIATGLYRKLAGVEVKERHIVNVTSLAPAK